MKVKKGVLLGIVLFCLVGCATTQQAVVTTPREEGVNVGSIVKGVLGGVFHLGAAVLSGNPLDIADAVLAVPLVADDIERGFKNKTIVEIPPQEDTAGQ